MLRPLQPSRSRWSMAAALLLIAAGAAAVVAYRAYAASVPRWSVTGPARGETLNADTVGQVRIAVRTDVPGSLDAAEVVLDGEDMTRDARRTRTSLVWEPAALADGDHAVTLRVPADFPRREHVERWSFTVDQTAPDVQLTAPTTVAIHGEPVTLAGRASPDAALTVDGAAEDGGATVERTPDGRFSVTFEEPPRDPVRVVATDAAGNRATSEPVAVAAVPSRVMADRIRGVHVSAHGWTDPDRREEVLELARTGRITAVQLDLKEETGHIGFDTDNPLAAELGADLGLYDLDEAVAELHALGVEIVGRVVVFRDGLLAQHAWDHGRRDDVVQTPDGRLYTGAYEGFGNIASEAVWDYNIAIAEEAAAAGVDNILWDYVRKPDGAMRNFTFPGLDPGLDPERAAQDAVLGFVARADERLAPYGVKHGASVYGVAADRPGEIAQDIPGMAACLDYVAPMVYPSHWAPGEYGVADPNAEPALIVRRSLERFLTAVEGTDAQVVPWLQDFPWPVRYTPAMVRDQIASAAEIGVDQWLMWNAGVYYQEEAYDPMPTPVGGVATTVAAGRRP